MIKGITTNSTKYTGFIGIDEVGRGPLAGPITVCAVYIEERQAAVEDLLEGIVRDSKRIKKTLRYNVYQTIRKNRYSKTLVRFAISSRSAAYIDRYGISKAAASCVKACLKKLEDQGVKTETTEINLDAGLKAPEKYMQQKSFIKGDERFVEIALASIMAKESRDTYMRRLAKKYPRYAWENNVGYGTLDHRKALQKHGATLFHRKSYLKGFKLLDKPE